MKADGFRRRFIKANEVCPKITTEIDDCPVY
jgi:hypothetical protein